MSSALSKLAKTVQEAFQQGFIDDVVMPDLKARIVAAKQEVGELPRFRKEEEIRMFAIQQASASERYSFRELKANEARDDTEEGKSIADWVIDAAKKYESYITGNMTPEESLYNKGVLDGAEAASRLPQDSDVQDDQEAPGVKVPEGKTKKKTKH